MPSAVELRDEEKTELAGYLTLVSYKSRSAGLPRQFLYLNDDKLRNPAGSRNLPSAMYIELWDYEDNMRSFSLKYGKRCTEQIDHILPQVCQQLAVGQPPFTSCIHQLTAGQSVFCFPCAESKTRVGAAGFRV